MVPEVDGWSRRDELYEKTEARLRTDTTDSWLERLLAVGIWAGPVYSYQDLVDDPQIAHNGTFVEYEHPTEGHIKTPGFPYKFSATPPRIDRGAPLIGEHSTEVLTELGVTSEQIAALFESGAVAGE
jgi:crotonobetainyl-CoA:carnitine CoA-transferase CaiB-like acyl-CoA transferase